MRLLSLPAEEELTLLRVLILAHGEDGWRSFWFFRFLMSLTPAISRTRSENAQRGCPQGAPCAEFCSTSPLQEEEEEEEAYFPPSAVRG